MTFQVQLLRFILIGLVHFAAANLLGSLAKRWNGCAACPPGWGASEPCTGFNETKCEKCQLGKTYSSIYSSESGCWPCSRCGIGLYEAKKCSLTKDTICNECINFIGNDNFVGENDFAVKCGFALYS